MAQFYLMVQRYLMKIQVRLQPRKGGATSWHHGVHCQSQIHWQRRYTIHGNESSEQHIQKTVVTNIQYPSSSDTDTGEIVPSVSPEQEFDFNIGFICLSHLTLIHVCFLYDIMVAPTVSHTQFTQTVFQCRTGTRLEGSS